MKNKYLKFSAYTILLSVLTLTGCSSDDSNGNSGGNPEPVSTRWITVAGAIMGATDGVPGDGNGGTLIYSISQEDAKNPDKTFDVFENGYLVPSARTARLQASEDGKTFFNIAYGGSNGGEFTKYIVNGGQNFTPIGGSVNISQYAGTSPRWVKLFDGDQTGVAVNVTTPVVQTDENGNYTRTIGTSMVLSLDMQNALISQVKSYEIPLATSEEAQGHHIFRLDAPVLNKAKNKLIIGTWMRKTNPETGANQTEFTRLGSKSVVVDYPSLDNPQVITSTISSGDTSGYRSHNSYLAEDGNIYQATQRDSQGAHILKINQNNQYDNSYVFNLDTALGVTGSYIENWKYVGEGKAIVLYTHDGSVISSHTQQAQGYIALVDLNAKTAQQIQGIPYHNDMYFFQYQGIVVVGDEIFLPLAPVSQDGNIYIINKRTGAVTKGARLLNKPGNHFIGAF